MWKDKESLRHFIILVYTFSNKSMRITQTPLSIVIILISYSPISVNILQEEEKTSGNWYARKSYMLCGKRESVSYIEKSHSIINPTEVFTPFTD